MVVLGALAFQSKLTISIHYSKFAQSMYLISRKETRTVESGMELM